MQGDLVVHLLAQSELHGPPSNLPPHRLQGILEAALRASSVAASPHAEVLLGEGVLSAAVDSRSLLQLVTAATCGSVDGGQQVCAQRLRMCFFSGALTSLSLFLHTHTLSHTFTHTHTRPKCTTGPAGGWWWSVCAPQRQGLVRQLLGDAADRCAPGVAPHAARQQAPTAALPGAAVTAPTCTTDCTADCTAALRGPDTAAATAAADDDDARSYLNTCSL
jgi:hypothetical protein